MCKFADMKYIEFNKIGDTGKTEIYEVNSLKGTKLGLIKWFANWRKYTFQPESNTVFDSKCMAEIIEFITKLMEGRK